MPLNVPKYQELPIEVDAPPGSSWGIFDKNGQRDRYGTLNFITSEAVLAAKEEIKTGQSVVLNLPMELPYSTCPGRTKLEHKRITTEHWNIYGCDDEISLNTQSSSQWDGLLHYAHQASKRYYNGISFKDAALLANDSALGIQALSERGGIVGRGVLVDFVTYAQQKGLQVKPLTNYAISLGHIKEILANENVAIKEGDILLIRTGLSKWIRESTLESVGPWEDNTYIGVDPTPEFLEWVWNSHIAALGSDATSVEAIPASDGTRMRLHEACLAGWGMMLGELLDLEELAKTAARNNQWTFFMTICPMNLKGGAATMANTLAVF